MFFLYIYNTCAPFASLRFLFCLQCRTIGSRFLYISIVRRHSLLSRFHFFRLMQHVAFCGNLLRLHFFVRERKQLMFCCDFFSLFILKLSYLFFDFRLCTRISSFHPFFNSIAVQKSSQLRKQKQLKLRKGIHVFNWSRELQINLENAIFLRLHLN